MNLLEETLDDIVASGHTTQDIVFIGSRSSGHSCTWAEFVALADREYDSGFGAQEVASDLEIVFGDGSTMWRDEYDGSEQWQYSTPFVAPQSQLPIASLFVEPPRVGWKTLAEINEQPSAGNNLREPGTGERQAD